MIYYALNQQLSLQSLKSLAEIDPADIFVADNLVGCAFCEHLTIMDDVGAIDDVERLADIVIRDQNADAAILQMLDELAEFR